MTAGPAPRPCESCPYRRDAPAGVWHKSEYEKLRAYDSETFAQPAGLFQCHQNDQGDPNARLCAGWVGCHGTELLALRLAVASGRVDADVFDYESPVPLFATGGEAAEHGMSGIDAPDDNAIRVMNKIRDRRDVRDG